MTQKQDLTALLGSRICHDLISPLGAIGNGVELLTMSGQTLSPEMQLIAESAAQANARIRYFRIAFGAASGNQPIGQTALVGLLADLGRGSRISVAWQVAGDQPRAAVKLAFLLLQCLESALPYGGTITVALEAGGQWQAQARASRLRMDPTLWSRLSGAEPAEIDAAKVQFALAAQELQAQGRSLSLSQSEDELRLSW